MEKISWLDKVTKEEVGSSQKSKMKAGKYWTLFRKGYIDGLAMF